MARSFTTLSLLFLLLLTLLACAPKPESQFIPSEPATVLDSATFGSLRGQVTFEGPLPDIKRSAVKSFSECAVFHKGKVITPDVLITEGKLQNVFIYVKEGLEGMFFNPPSKPAVLDQLGCFYEPHVLGVQVGQKILIKNSDPTLHNVHAKPKLQREFNIGMPVIGMQVTKMFQKAEVMIPLSCDVHSWMKMYVGVLPHPYFAVSQENGKFMIKDLPEGKYTLEAWHEVFGTKSQIVNIQAGEITISDIIFVSEK
jgi:plastocyanin